MKKIISGILILIIILSVTACGRNSKLDSKLAELESQLAENTKTEKETTAQTTTKATTKKVDTKAATKFGSDYVYDESKFQTMESKYIKYSIVEDLFYNSDSDRDYNLFEYFYEEETSEFPFLYVYTERWDGKVSFSDNDWEGFRASVGEGEVFRDVELLETQEFGNHSYRELRAKTTKGYESYFYVLMLDDIFASFSFSFPEGTVISNDLKQLIEHILKSVELTSGSSTAQETEETSNDLGSRKNPASFDDGVIVTGEYLGNPIEYVITLSNLITGPEAETLAKEYNMFNEWSAEEEPIIYTATFELIKYDNKKDDSYYVSDWDFDYFDSSFGELRFSNYLTLKTGDQFGGDVYEGGKITGLIGEIIPKGEKLHILFDDLVWFKMP